ncbi:hypothetical protein Tco_1572526, partial [Tanacetum coccineum]
MSANNAGMTSDIGSKQAMSDKAASRKAVNTDIESKKVTFPKVRHANVELFLDQLHADVTKTIVVMIGQKWDVSVMMGHYTARENVAYNLLKLKEGAIYLIKNFTVKPNKGEYLIYMKECSSATGCVLHLLPERSRVRAQPLLGYATHPSVTSAATSADMWYEVAADML